MDLKWAHCEWFQGVAEGRFSRSFIENYFILNAFNPDAFMTSFLDLNHCDVNKILHPNGNQEYSRKSVTVYHKYMLSINSSLEQSLYTLPMSTNVLH